MKKIFSFLLLGLLLSIGNLWAETTTVSASAVASSSASWTGTGNESWSVSVNGGATGQNVTSSYAQVGTRNNPSTSITFSTSGISGTITSIVVDCASYQGKATVSATVGGSDFGTQNQSSPSWSNNSGGEVTFTGSGTGAIVVTMTNGTGGRAMYIKSITVTYTAGGSPSTPTCVTPIFSPAAGTYTAAQNVELSCSTDGATIYYTTDGSEPTTTSSVYSDAINVSATTTIKAIAVKAGMDNSAIATAAYTIISIEHAGTEADPYSVADARNAIDANTGKTSVYATGIVSEIVTAYSSQFGNVTFDIIDENGSETLRAYRCGGTNAANVAEGDIVVVSGDLTLYGSTYEFAQGCEIVSLTHPVSTDPSISVSATEINATAAETEGTITVTYNNITTVAADVYFCNATGTADATYDWITASINNNNNLEYLVEENTTTEVRNAYLKVWAYDDEENAVYSELITISQAGKVGPNFTWDLSTDNTLTATETEMSWGSNYATMIAAKANASTPTNNYYPGANDRTSTRLYSGSTLTITPTSGYSIAKVVFEATTTNYANALSNSTWTNASASVDETVVTITPTNGSIAVSATIGATCGFNSVQVFYNGPAAASLTLGANGYSTYAAGFAYTVSGGATAYKAHYDAQQGAVVLAEVSGVIPAEQGIILKGEQGAPVTITPSAEEVTADFSDNQLVGVVSATVAPANAHVLATIDDDNVTKFHPCAGILIPANKAYMEIAANGAPVRIIFAENNATAINNLEGDENAVKFIENGKLYIRKNGVVYDATGAVVR